MRPIDADALKEVFIQTLENIKSNPRMTGQEMHIITAIHTVGQMIDDAPTIDAEPIYEFEDDDAYQRELWDREEEESGI